MFKFSKYLFVQPLSQNQQPVDCSNGIFNLMDLRVSLAVPEVKELIYLVCSNDRRESVCVLVCGGGVLSTPSY